MEFTPDEARDIVARLNKTAPRADLAPIVGPVHATKTGDDAATPDTATPDAATLAEAFGGLDQARLLRVVDAGLTALQHASLEGQTDGQVINGLDTVDEFRARTDAVYLRYVAHVDHTGAHPAANTGAASTADLLSTRRGISPGRAKADVAAATALHGKRPSTTALTPAPIAPAPLTRMGDQLASGTIRIAHIDTAVRTLERIPHRLLTDGDNATLPQSITIVAGFFADHAPTTRPQTLNGLAKELLRRLDPDTDDHYDPYSFERRNVTMGADPTGMTFGTFQLDPAAAAEFRACLDPLSAPRPDQVDSEGSLMVRDDRSPGQRRADGLIDIVRLAADALKIPLPGHAHGDGSAHAHGDGSAHAHGNGSAHAHGNGSTHGDGSTHGRGEHSEDPGGATAGGERAPDGGADGKNSADHEGTTPADPAGTDHVPGLFEIAAPTPGKGSEADCESAPGSRADKFRPGRRGPRVFIVTTLDQIAAVPRGKPPDPPWPGEDPSTDPPTDGTSHARGSPSDGSERGSTQYEPIDPTPSHCDQLGEISPGTLARMTCDALFQRVVQGPNGAVLDLGTAARLASGAQRHALHVRDRGCTFPGCDRPSGWCDAHHVWWYSRGGTTRMSNLVLLCPAHHTLIHTGRWEVQMFDGIPYYRHAPVASADRPYIYGTTVTADDWIRNSYFDQLRQAREVAADIVKRQSR